jgi:hypothetical protein
MAHVTPAEEPKKDQKDAGRDLREVFLTTLPEQFNIQPSEDYPRGCGIALDWPIGENVATVISLSDGSASVYTTRTFGIIGGIGVESVRTAAKKLVKEADRRTLTLLQPTTSLTPRPIVSASFLLRSTAYASSRPIYGRCEKDEGSTRRSSIWRKMLLAGSE